jgi:hypothetical protein
MALSGVFLDKVLTPTFGTSQVLGYRVAFLLYGSVIALAGIAFLRRFLRESVVAAD